MLADAGAGVGAAGAGSRGVLFLERLLGLGHFRQVGVSESELAITSAEKPLASPIGIQIAQCR